MGELARETPGQDRVLTNPGGVATLEKGITLLRLCLQAGSPLDVAAMARCLELSRGNVYKYLRTLQTCRFLARRDGQKAFGPGSGLLQLLSTARNPACLVGVAYPVLKDLVAETNETAILAALRDNRAVCLSRVESSRSVRLTYRTGASYPLHAGASGQVLIATLGQDEQRRILSSVPLSSYTDETVVSLRMLSSRLQEIREQGFAVTRGELDEGAFAVAAPVRVDSLGVVASISLGGPLDRFPSQKELDYGRLVRAAAAKVRTYLSEIAALDRETLGSSDASSHSLIDP